MKTVLGIDIGGTRLRAALVREDGTVLSVQRTATPSVGGAASAVPAISALCDGVIEARAAQLRRANREERPVAIGISFGGPVDFSSQRVLRSQHVAGWEEVDIVGELSTRFGIPARVDNDANVAALGEYLFGAGRGAGTMVYLTVSTGIGGAVIHHGSVVRGHNGLAGEIGHIVVEPGGRRCACGKHGCVEAYASGSSLARMSEELVSSDPERAAAIVAEAGGRAIDSAAVYRAASGGDSAAEELVDRSIGALASGIATVANVVDPDIVVIGGGVSREGERFLGPLARYVSERAMFLEAYPVEIVPALLGDDSGLIGAAALAIRG